METAEFKVVTDEATNVVYINIADPVEGSVIDVYPVESEISPEGLIIARVERDSDRLLGFVIQDFSVFKRKLLWKKGTRSIQRGIELICDSFRAKHPERHISGALC